MRNAVDYSYARPSGAELAQANLDAIFYTGNARPDAAYIQDLRDHDRCILFVQETYSTRSQEGYEAGVLDTQFADSRSSEVGYPLDAAIVYVVSDGSSSDPSYGAENIAEYARGVADTSQRPFLFYGNRYCVVAAETGAGRSPGGRHYLGSWLPSTWGANPAVDLLVQEANIASPIPDTDLNTVYRPYGAWGMSDSPGPVDPDFSGITSLIFNRVLSGGDMYVGVNAKEGWFVVENGIITSHFTGAPGAYGVPSDMNDSWKIVPSKPVSDSDVAQMKALLGKG